MIKGYIILLSLLLILPGCANNPSLNIKTITNQQDSNNNEIKTISFEYFFRGFVTLNENPQSRSISKPNPHRVLRVGSREVTFLAGTGGEIPLAFLGNMGRHWMITKPNYIPHQLTLNRREKSPVILLTPGCFYDKLQNVNLSKVHSRDFLCHFYDIDSINSDLILKLKLILNKNVPMLVSFIFLYIAHFTRKKVTFKWLFYFWPVYIPLQTDLPGRREAMPMLVFMDL